MWSRKYSECQECHTTDYPYRSNGYCKDCYYAAHYRDNKEKFKAYHRKYYRTDKGKQVHARQTRKNVIRKKKDGELRRLIVKSMDVPSNQFKELVVKFVKDNY